MAIMDPKQGGRWDVPTIVERSLVWYSLVQYETGFWEHPKMLLCVFGGWESIGVKSCCGL